MSRIKYIRKTNEEETPTKLIDTFTVNHVHIYVKTPHI